MIVDTSAIIAILTGEPDSDRFFQALKGDDAPVMSAGTRVELAAVIVRKRLPATDATVAALFGEFNLTIVPFSARQAELAGDAYRRYGRGTGHPARLNLGDCFAYALARDRNEPLLFKGNDLRLTDIVGAV